MTHILLDAIAATAPYACKTVPYACKACGKPVLLVGGKPAIWVCEHQGDTVIAHMAAQITARSEVA